jgi:hypothetical protein
VCVCVCVCVCVSVRARVRMFVHIDLCNACIVYAWARESVHACLSPESKPHGGQCPSAFFLSCDIAQQTQDGFEGVSSSCQTMHDNDDPLDILVGGTVRPQTKRGNARPYVECVFIPYRVHFPDNG